MYVFNYIKEEIKIDLFSYNDYELFYLYRGGSEEALEILFAKYSVLISKKIRDFYLYNDYDDIYQESLFVLYKSILRYDDTEYSFFFYFYTALVNKLRSVKRKEKNNKIDVNESFLIMRDVSDSFDYHTFSDELYSKLTESEISIIHLHFIKKINVKEIAKMYSVTEMRIYYIINTSRKKIKKRAEELGYI